PPATGGKVAPPTWGTATPPPGVNPTAGCSGFSLGGSRFINSIKRSPPDFRAGGGSGTTGGACPGSCVGMTGGEGSCLGAASTAEAPTLEGGSVTSAPGFLATSA